MCLNCIRVSMNALTFPQILHSFLIESTLIAYSLLLHCVNSIFLSQFFIPFGAAAHAPFPISGLSFLIGLWLTSEKISPYRGHLNFKYSDVGLVRKSAPKSRLIFLSIYVHRACFVFNLLRSQANY